MKNDMVDWNNYFVYCEDSPSKLINKIDRHPKAKAGTYAGYLRKDGYWLIGHKCKNVLVHRVVYELFYGDIGEGKQIDHIDGNRSNNCIVNLREVDSKTNQRNMKRDKRNSSGVTGVSYLKIIGRKGNINEYWSALWKENNKQMAKRFSITKLGNEIAFNEACKFRKYKIEELNNSGYNYSERHGT